MADKKQALLCKVLNLIQLSQNPAETIDLLNSYLGEIEETEREKPACSKED